MANRPCLEKVQTGLWVKWLLIEVAENESLWILLGRRSKLRPEQNSQPLTSSCGRRLKSLPTPPPPKKTSTSFRSFRLLNNDLTTSLLVAKKSGCFRCRIRRSCLQTGSRPGDPFRGGAIPSIALESFLGEYSGGTLWYTVAYPTRSHVFFAILVVCLIVC